MFIGADLAEAASDIEPTGLPVLERLALPEELPATAELSERTARLHAWAERLRVGGYIVGDGLEGGRPATPDEIARLAGTDEAGIPVGLVRCSVCRAHRGDFLALRGEGDGDPTPRVVRVHCRCENHNRCARCGGPLAERRLSAYHFAEDRDSLCYVAAYCAFSHRCDPASQSARLRS